jgi:hypothetical protein
MICHFQKRMMKKTKTKNVKEPNNCFLTRMTKKMTSKERNTCFCFHYAKGSNKLAKIDVAVKIASEG